MKNFTEQIIKSNFFKIKKNQKLQNDGSGGADGVFVGHALAVIMGKLVRNIMNRQKHELKLMRCNWSFPSPIASASFSTDASDGLS